MSNLEFIVEGIVLDWCNRNEVDRESVYGVTLQYADPDTGIYTVGFQSEGIQRFVKRIPVEDGTKLIEV